MPEEIEQKALEMGWSRKEDFRGDPERWVDAETYVKRGEEFIPFLKATSKKQADELETLRGELQQTKGLLKASSEAIEELKKFNSAAARKEAEVQRGRLVEGIKEARQEGDVEKEESLREQLEDTKAALKEAEKPPAARPNGASEDYTKTPEFQTWQGEHDWFGKDRRKTALALGIADELRHDPANRGLMGKAFLDKVTEEVNKTLGTSQRPNGASKVEGDARSASQGGGGRTASRSYSELPQEAKAACERQAARVVGPGRAFKDVSEWRSHYATKYFEE